MTHPTPPSERDAITWPDRVQNLARALNRWPTLDELMTACQVHIMTPQEIEEQRQSLARGMAAKCEHGEYDFEHCSKCRG